MNASNITEVVGRKIARVWQRPVATNVGEKHELCSMLLDDGTLVVFTAYETENHPVPVAHIVTPTEEKL